MAVVGALFGKVFLAAFNKEIDWLDDAIHCTLHTSLYVPDQDVHDYVDDLSNEHAASGNYATGGVQLAGKTITYTGATNKITMDANDAVWAASTITARVAVVSDRQTGVAGTSPLIAYQQSDADISSNNGEFRVQWNASGLCEITVGAPA
ncbi:MAG: hypothetical protein C4551_10045 [Bacillota bacterium]|jgi:hypothetical protein|nr:MAG: hypothetical protein C4551_10045 [Bacillota bacterium]